MKTSEEIMEILAAYDLAGSYRGAAELTGCDHHTVRRYVQLRGTGVDPSVRAERPKMVDEFMPKVEELVEQSKGKIGADVVYGERAFGGVPTYCLTDNEKTVTTDHVTRVAVRNPTFVPIGRYTARWCARACPQIRLPGAAARPRSASPSVIWCPPR